MARVSVLDLVLNNLQAVAMEHPDYMYMVLIKEGSEDCISPISVFKSVCSSLIHEFVSITDNSKH